MSGRIRQCPYLREEWGPVRAITGSGLCSDAAIAALWRRLREEARRRGVREWEITLQRLDNPYMSDDARETLYAMRGKPKRGSAK